MRFWTDKRWEIGEGGLTVDNLKTDFHAYYTNGFMIFDVATGLGACQSLGGGAGVGRGCLFLSHLGGIDK